jgi:hypothetical protein
MKRFVKFAGLSFAALLLAGSYNAPALAQSPAEVVPITAPIIISAVKPRPKNTGLAKFEGYVMNANIAQITARAKDNETSIQTFSLSQPASLKMQMIVDKGGYQYGDKVTIYYDPTTRQAIKFKGKPSKPI